MRPAPLRGLVVQEGASYKKQGYLQSIISKSLSDFCLRTGSCFSFLNRIPILKL
jgi:hypothetical protein